MEKVHRFAPPACHCTAQSDHVLLQFPHYQCQAALHGHPASVPKLWLKTNQAEVGLSGLHQLHPSKCGFYFNCHALSSTVTPVWVAKTLPSMVPCGPQLFLLLCHKFVFVATFEFSNDQLCFQGNLGIKNCAKYLVNSPGLAASAAGFQLLKL